MRPTTAVPRPCVIELRNALATVVIRRRTVMVAAVTPLASILGSGLLIIVPVLEGTLGALSIVGAVAVCRGLVGRHRGTPLRANRRAAGRLR